MSYDYPPSEHIRRFEPFEPNSHYYVRGDCLFEGKKYPCDFEVAYTLSGQIYVASYMEISYQVEIFSDGQIKLLGKQLYSPKKNNIEVDFSGTELRNGYRVDIRRAISRGNPIISPLPRPAIFDADSYSIEITNEDVLYDYPPEETLFQVVNAGGNDDVYNANPFDVDGEKLLTLTIAKQPATNSTLSVPSASCPTGWTEDDVAELWCSCVSMATGTDIRWILKSVRADKAVIKTFVYRRNIIRNLHTEGILTTHSHLGIDDTVHQFVRAVFSCARNSSVSLRAARAYSRIMWHFVEYRLITNRAEDQARLISTTVEELLTLWEDHMRNTPNALVSAEEAGQILEHLQTEYPNQLREITGITDRTRLDALNSRLNTFFTEEILRPGFGKRLKKFFELGKNDDTWLKSHVPEARLESFIRTRNKIAHEGRFPSKDSFELFDYHYDMLTILPLMFFAIFGYTGSFIDLGKEYRRLNTKHLAQLKSQDAD